ncbi:MAG: helix-turn-helix domain-containing protein [Gammaproteobacteria bacterium]|nr:helix-turn-helix domain-containing protein [Gammaproteobacteria bacterium]
MTSENIARTVRYFRKQSGITQLALAQLAGVGKTVVFDIEKAKTTVQLDSLLKVLAVLNIKLTLETPYALPAENKT